ncbi:MAG: hypothetical protein P1P64_04270 [Treponemataceae bacterium]
MKKIKFNFIFFVVLVVLAFSSCVSAAQSYDINRVRYSEPEISDISIDNYEVLGRISGIGTVTNKKLFDGSFEGDTKKYGSLDMRDSIYFNVSNVKELLFETPYDVALANATYQLIEKANELKADTILFVRSTTKSDVKGANQTITVTISGLAVKLK